MDQRISVITLGVADLGASRRFYVDGLGWTPALEDPGEVLMFRAGPLLVLSLWDRAHFAAEVGGRLGGGPDDDAVVPVTLAHNVTAPAEVDAVLATAAAAGARHVQPARERAWGGCTGYFTDPDGFHWEVAHNPGPIGTAVLP